MQPRSAIAVTVLCTVAGLSFCAAKRFEVQDTFRKDGQQLQIISGRCAVKAVAVLLYTLCWSVTGILSAVLSCCPSISAVLLDCPDLLITSLYWSAAFTISVYTPRTGRIG